MSTVDALECMRARAYVERAPGLGGELAVMLTARHGAAPCEKWCWSVGGSGGCSSLIAALPGEVPYIMDTHSFPSAFSVYRSDQVGDRKQRLGISARSRR